MPTGIYHYNSYNNWDMARRQLLSGSLINSNVSLTPPPNRTDPSTQNLLPSATLDNSLRTVGQVAQNNMLASQELRSTVGTAGSTQSQPFTGQVRIAQIDNFTTDQTGFNHGQEIANTLRNGGNDPNMRGKVDLLQYDVSKGGGSITDRIADSLENVAQRVQNGEQIDAVNLSMQDFQASGDTQRVKAAIEQLSQLGVPVAVAAGNGGRDTVNQLTGNSSFNVQSATDGNINQDSGLGNITAEGQTTSFATANLTPLLARMKASGASVGDIRSRLGVIGAPPRTTLTNSTQSQNLLSGNDQASVAGNTQQAFNPWLWLLSLFTGAR